MTDSMLEASSFNLAWDLAPGDVIAFDFRTLHGTTAGRVEGRRRALSTRWLGDDVTYCERPSETSPPFPDIGLQDGDPMREDRFPVIRRRMRMQELVGSPPARPGRREQPDRARARPQFSPVQGANENR